MAAKPTTGSVPSPPSPEKTKEAFTELETKKSKNAEAVEHRRSESKQLREDWSQALKKSKGKGKGRGKGRAKGKGKGKAKYQVKKDEEGARMEAIEKLEKTLEKKRSSSLLQIEKLEKSLRPKKPVFGKVKDIQPDAKGLNLMLKCTGCKQVEGPSDVWEAVCGDETGVVTFSLRSKEHAEICTEGASLRVQNAKVLMVKGYIRVAVDKWAVLKPADAPLEFTVDTKNDVSATEYELEEADEQ